MVDRWPFRSRDLRPRLIVPASKQPPGRSLAHGLHQEWPSTASYSGGEVNKLGEPLLNRKDSDAMKKVATARTGNPPSGSAGSPPRGRPRRWRSRRLSAGADSPTCYATRSGSLRIATALATMKAAAMPRTTRMVTR